MQTKVKRYVVCLKYGDKYSAEYVNKLYNMVQRYLSLDHDFICITDNNDNLNPEIKTIPLNVNNNISTGWWYKVDIFADIFKLSGTILFLDLDIVIFNSIDKLFEFKSDETFCISRGFRKDNKNGMNSSCFRFKTGVYNHIYNKFAEESNEIMNRLHGDQDWLQEQINSFSFWPDNWLLSYKWDMLRNDEINYNHETAVSVFHGRPNPHELDNEWIKEHWR